MNEHIDARTVLEDLRSIGHRYPRTTTVDLGVGWTAWNPASVKGSVDGPAVVTYTQNVDGCIEVTIRTERGIRQGTDLGMS